MTAKRYRQTKIWLLSMLNGFFMLVFAFYWLSLPYTFGDEAFLIKWSSLIKKSLFGFDSKPLPDDIFFVDVSNSKTVIDAENEFGDISQYHRKVITDREHLTAFFKMLNEHHADIRFVLCDVIFEDKTPYDSLLAKEFSVLGKKLLGVSYITNTGEYITPVIDISHAPATYTATQNVFLKFPLILSDTLKTVPLVMYEKLHDKHLHRKGFFYRFDGQLSLPSPIVDFKVRNADFGVSADPNKPNFTIWKMSTILWMRDHADAEELKTFFKNKIILIGDFQDDIHNTPFGQMPGLLIIYNAYLTLASGQHLILVGWMFFLLLAFSMVSYRILLDVKVEKPRWLLNIFQSRFGQTILNSLDEVVLLTIITLLSYFLFNIHINILILLIYLKTIEFLWKKALKRRRRKSPEIEMQNTAISDY